MKKIVFVIESMNVGGTEKALLSLLNEIPQNKYDVTVLILEKYGGFLDYIPSWVNVKFLDKYDEIKNDISESPKNVALRLLKDKKVLKSIKTVWNYSAWRFFGNKMYYFNKQILNIFNDLEEEYDVAISYQGPPSHFSAYYVLNRIRAKKKIQWIHSDVSKLNLDIISTNKLYELFDKIFVVSETAKDKFIELFPEQQDKTEVFYNIISSSFIKKQSEYGDGFEDNYKGTRILTVGRLSGEKGQGMTIPVLYKLKKEGYDVRWYCVGDGPNRDIYNKTINEYSLENDYVLLGSRINPYPYFKECDIYVQPSKFEGYCITLAEARVFNKPIVTTDFIGAREQISNNKDGIIVEYSDKQVYEAIRRLLDNKNLRKSIEQNLTKSNVDTTHEIEKLYEIIESI